MDQKKAEQGGVLDFTSFGVPESAVNAADPEYAEEEAVEEEETAVDETDEDTEDGDTSSEDEDENLELDDDTDPGDVDDVDLRDALQAAEKNRRDMQAERDSYKANFENLKRQQAVLDDRLQQLEQQTKQSAAPSDPLAGKDDDDYMTVAEVKERDRKLAEARQNNQPAAPRQDPWLYQQNDYDEVMDFVTANQRDLERDPRFYGLSQKESFITVRSVMKEKQLKELEDKVSALRKREKQITKKKHRVPKTGGTRVRSSVSSKKKLTPLEKVFDMGV